MNQYQERIRALREKMQETGIDVYFIPMSDCHNSEYVAPHFRCIEYISGFTGSAASVVVTAQQAWLFTDGRYYIQAANQLEGSGIELMKAGQPGVPELTAWIKETAAGKVLGFDGSVVSAELGMQISDGCEVRYDRDLVGEIWNDRPEQVFTDIFQLPLQYTGEAPSSKIRRIRDELEALVPAQSEYLYILNSLDDIAWVFNLRANDIQDNPVPYAYAAISRNQVQLFTGVDLKESEASIRDGLEGSLICGPYTHACLCMEGYGTVLLDKSRISYDTWKYYKEQGVRMIPTENPSTRMKAVKNDTEIQCLKEALIRDSAVVVRFMYWLKKHIGEIPMDEVSVADYLLELRRQQEGFLEPSFSTISAYRENAAQMHYSPGRGHCSRLKPESFLLVDSGAQYMDGTTDITRTFSLGPLTDNEKKAFSLTAASMLRLLNTRFLKGCRGENLDAIAREPMWKAGWDYKCGTGHGVGHVLNVHEGPHRIKWTIDPNHLTAVLEPGMVVTNEPGVYREGELGVRTENEMLVTTCMETEDGIFYQFDNLTWIPIDLDAIDKTWLSTEDIRMLNEYHQKVFEIIAPRVSSEIREWLKEYTRTI